MKAKKTKRKKYGKGNEDSKAAGVHENGKNGKNSNTSDKSISQAAL